MAAPYKSEVLAFEGLAKLFKEASGEPDTKDAFEAWLLRRDRARKDLFYLGRDVLKKNLVPEVHQVVCDNFVMKNFDGVYVENYSLDDVHKAIARQKRGPYRGGVGTVKASDYTTFVYDREEFSYNLPGLPSEITEKEQHAKQMVLLDPRGFYKSTIDGIDCVQWIINVPDVRILILTGEDELAEAFLSEVKGYFYQAPDSQPTPFHKLFPEFVIRGVKGYSAQPLIVPARRHNQKEATLWVNSVTSNLSGWHCDIKKTDDVVTNRNSFEDDQRKKVNRRINSTNNLVDEWGWTDNIGTRYAGGEQPDWFGFRLALAKNKAPIRVFKRQCWNVKPGFEDVVEKNLKEVTLDMVELNFWQKLGDKQATFDVLVEKIETDEVEFRCQQLNEPAANKDDDKFTFELADLRQHMIQPHAVPAVGDIVVVWDWAETSRSYSDMSCGIAAKIVEKNGIHSVHILEVIFGRWKPDVLAFQMVSFHKKWNPKFTTIERSTGSELLQLELQRQALKYGVTFNPNWKPVSHEDNAKRNRIRGLHILLANDRLWFVMGPWIDETFAQFTRYTGEKKNRGRKDDIPDAASQLQDFLPNTKDNDALKQMQEQQKLAAKRAQNYNRIFGGYPQRVQADEIAPKPVDPRREAFSKIFGGNGMRG